MVDQEYVEVYLERITIHQKSDSKRRVTAGIASQEALSLPCIKIDKFYLYNHLISIFIMIGMKVTKNRKRKSNQEQLGSRKTRTVSKADKRMNRLKRKFRKMFKSIDVSTIAINSLADASIDVNFPSESSLGEVHTTTFSLRGGEMRFSCNCVQLYRDGDPIVNCKHVTCLIFSLMKNFFVIHVPTAMKDIKCSNKTVVNMIISFMKQSYITIDPTDRISNNKLNKALKRLKIVESKQHLITKHQKCGISIPVFESKDIGKRGEIVRLSLNDGRFMATCACSGHVSNNCEHVARVIVNLLTNFFYSFKVSKKFNKKQAEKDYAELFADIFSKLSLEDTP